MTAAYKPRTNPRAVVLGAPREIGDKPDHLLVRGACRVARRDGDSIIHVPAAIDASLPVYGRRCDCRRSTVVLVEPVEQAPPGFAEIEATVDGERVPVAVPEPALDGVQAVVGGDVSE